MRRQQVLQAVIVLMLDMLFLTGCGSKANSSLTCDGGTFSHFRLTNINERSYTAMGQTCRLTPEDEGVIWIAVGEGHAMSDAPNEIVFKDDKGRQFRHICWTDTGMIGGVTATRMILFGPSDSKRITVCCGDACADVQIE